MKIIHSEAGDGEAHKVKKEVNMEGYVLVN